VKIIILGASGLIGVPLVARLRERGDEVATASLRDVDAAARACDGADAVVNLAGEPVAQRWSPKVKAAIRASRVDAGAALIDLLGRLGAPPKRYVSASAVGYYGPSDDTTFDESSGPGGDFLADVCVAWERTADAASRYGMKVTKVRTGIVLGTKGGALAKLLPVFRAGAGGIVGSGRQWYSWIHIDDQVGIYLHAIDEADGVLNATAPEPVRNADFTHALGAALHRPAVLPVPGFALRAMLGEGASVVTTGQRVVPKRTIESGYAFRYPSLGPALRALLD